MSAWIEAKTLQPGENLPELYVVVDAKDEDGNEFPAMLVQGDVWAYADEERFGVVACVTYWRYRS
jgi:hypothetical protein